MVMELMMARATAIVSIPIIGTMWRKNAYLTVNSSKIVLAQRILLMVAPAMKALNGLEISANASDQYVSMIPTAMAHTFGITATAITLISGILQQTHVRLSVWE